MEIFCTQSKIGLEWCSLTFYRKECGFKLPHGHTDSKMHSFSDLSLVCCSSSCSKQERIIRESVKVHPNSRDNEKKNLSKSWRSPSPLLRPNKNSTEKVTLLMSQPFVTFFLPHKNASHYQQVKKQYTTIVLSQIQATTRLIQPIAQASNCQQTKQIGYQIIHNRPRMVSSMSLKNKMAAKISGVLIDLSGTIHVENTVMPGAIQALKR